MPVGEYQSAELIVRITNMQKGEKKCEGGLATMEKNLSGASYSRDPKRTAGPEALRMVSAAQRPGQDTTKP